MANLSDMEELLHTIDDEQIRDYMHEALTCYMTKAYRGCIVLCFIALFDDITNKLGTLANINRAAKEIYNNVKSKKDEQEVYENFLLTQLLSKKLLPEIDVEFADILRKLRNKSAHPSGHKPSAEEARYVFYEVINRFLSKPIFSVDYLIDEIIERLHNTNFFVGTKSDEIAAIVQEEISSLHPEAIPSLIAKLIKLDKKNNKTLLKNFNFFIIGLLKTEVTNIDSIIEKQLIIKKCDDDSYSTLILGIIATKPIIFKNLKGATLERVNYILESSIKNKLSSRYSDVSHPVNVLNKQLEVYENKDYILKFSTNLKTIFKNIPTFNALKNLFKNPEVFNLYFDIICSKAGSSSFDIANDFAESSKNIENIYIDYISDEQSFKILTAITKASNHGAFKSGYIVGDKFSTLDRTKKKAIKYINEHHEAANQYFKEITQNDIPAYLKTNEA